MEYKITMLLNKIKFTKDTFGKISLIQELNELINKYKSQLIIKFKKESLDSSKYK
jgi:hypothetical protein